jgi:hypothetical protein
LSSGVPGSLQAEGTAEIFPSIDGHDLLSVLIDIKGRLPSGRSGQSYIPLMFDLADGCRVSFESLFSDEAAARVFIEELSFDVFSEDLSNYLNIDDLFPFPLDRVLVRETGLSFYYPENSLTWLSGRSASIHYLYHELESVLDFSEGSLLYDLGITELLSIQADSAEKIRNAAKSGSLPGIDARLGESIEGLTKRHHLKFDPEGFPEGELYQLENDIYRGTILLSEDGNRVSGILSRRINMFGLIAGRTDRAETLSVMGTPSTTLPFESAAADAYGLPEGELVGFLFGDNELRLYFDLDGLLNAVWLRPDGQKAAENR